MINITLTGNIGADATIKQVNTDTVLNFVVACKTMKGREAVVTWIDCAIWGKRADSLHSYLKKGTAVTVLGNLAAVETFTNKAGELVSKIKVTVLDVALQGGRPDAEQQISSSNTTGSNTVGTSDDLPF
jgi:single-strand DNA-binding protein